MSAFIWTDNHDGYVRLQCSAHPYYEGTRRAKAYLAGCLGCRAVYAVRQADVAAPKVHVRLDVVYP